MTNDSPNPEAEVAPALPLEVKPAIGKDPVLAKTLAENQDKARADQLQAESAASAAHEQALIDQAALELSVPAEVPISLEEYAEMRGLGAFGQGVMVAGARSYNRPFSEWEQARQLLLGG